MRVFAVIAGFILLVGLLAVGLRLNPREVPSPLIGKPAPSFQLPLLNAPEDETAGTFGYFVIERDDLWTGDDDLPEHWMEPRARGPRVRGE